MTIQFTQATEEAIESCFELLLALQEPQSAVSTIDLSTVLFVLRNKQLPLFRLLSEKGIDLLKLCDQIDPRSSAHATGSSVQVYRDEFVVLVRLLCTFVLNSNSPHAPPSLSPQYLVELLQVSISIVASSTALDLCQSVHAGVASAGENAESFIRKQQEEESEQRRRQEQYQRYLLQQQQQQEEQRQQSGNVSVVSSSSSSSNILKDFLLHNPLQPKPQKATGFEMPVRSGASSSPLNSANTSPSAAARRKVVGGGGGRFSGNSLNPSTFNNNSESKNNNKKKSNHDEELFRLSLDRLRTLELELTTTGSLQTARRILGIFEKNIPELSKECRNLWLYALDERTSFGGVDENTRNELVSAALEVTGRELWSEAGSTFEAAEAAAILLFQQSR